ncbi:MAG: hypothetical protein ACRD0N_09725 [Acidimicrobiales bacterium]
MEPAVDLDGYVQLDPLLIEPLDLYGGRARRRHIVAALARAMELDDRHEVQREAPEVGAYLWAMVDPLLDVLAAGRPLALDERAQEVAREVAVHGNAVAALAVLLALGAGPVRFPGGSLGDVCHQVHQALPARTEALVLALLRRWARAGYIRDVSAVS